MLHEFFMHPQSSWTFPLAALICFRSWKFHKVPLSLESRSVHKTIQVILFRETSCWSQSRSISKICSPLIRTLTSWALKTARGFRWIVESMTAYQSSTKVVPLFWATKTEHHRSEASFLDIHYTHLNQVLENVGRAGSEMIRDVSLNEMLRSDSYWQESAICRSLLPELPFSCVGPHFYCISPESQEGTIHHNTIHIILQYTVYTHIYTYR